jgi:flagellar hook-associated protein FlgK
MIEIRDANTGATIGSITEAQLAFLTAQLEEESAQDTDYYINQATLDLFEQRGADPALVTLLRQALGSREDIDIEWSR